MRSGNAHQRRAQDTWRKRGPRTPACEPPPEPADPGNRRAQKHGAYARVAADRMEAKAREVFEALAADAPLRDGDGALPPADAMVVRRLAECLCRVESVG